MYKIITINPQINSKTRSKEQRHAGGLEIHYYSFLGVHSAHCYKKGNTIIIKYSEITTYHKIMDLVLNFGEVITIINLNSPVMVHEVQW